MTASTLSVKAVIFNHNQRSSADELFERLSACFDTALIDSGSRPDQISAHSTVKGANIYWSGLWNKAWELFPRTDVIWGVGGDCTLKDKAEDYLKAIQSAYPFGTWSPVISGKSHDYMQPQVAAGQTYTVQYLEGMALAIARPLWHHAGPFDSDNHIGQGLDLHCCFTGRRHNLKNVLDGRVEVNHPPGSGYDVEEARRLMHACLSKKYGSDWQDVLDWWWGRTVSFKANAISRIHFSNGERSYIRPFLNK